MQAEGYLAEYHKCKINNQCKKEIKDCRRVGRQHKKAFEYIENIPLVVALVKKLNIRVPVSR